MDLSRYRRFLGTRGVPRLFASVITGRLPSGMLTLAIILRLTSAHRTYAVAGAVSAAFTACAGLVSPVLSRLIDRRGQTVVLIPCGFGLLAATVVLATLPAHSPAPVLMLGGALVGCTVPPLGNTSRALWRAVITEDDVLESAFAMDAAMQELLFIIGPLLVVMINAAFGGPAAIVATGVLGCVGTLSFAFSPTSRGWRPTPHDGRRHAALRSPGVRVLMVAMFALITGFAATDVAVIAAARHASGNGASGIVLAVWAGGSLLGGLIYGARTWRGRPMGRSIALLGATATLTLLLAALPNVLLIGIVIGIAGLTCAPALAGVNLTVQHVAPVGAVTESYAWIALGSLVGASAGAAICGAVVTVAGAHAGFVFAGAAIALAVTVLFAGRRALLEPDIATTPALATTGA